MGEMASQITSPTIVYSIVHSGADRRIHQISASLAFVVTGEFPAQMGSNAENVSFVDVNRMNAIALTECYITGHVQDMKYCGTYEMLDNGIIPFFSQ